MSEPVPYLVICITRCAVFTTGAHIPHIPDSGCCHSPWTDNWPTPGVRSWVCFTYSCSGVTKELSKSITRPRIYILKRMLYCRMTEKETKFLNDSRKGFRQQTNGIHDLRTNNYYRRQIWRSLNFWSYLYMSKLRERINYAHRGRAFSPSWLQTTVLTPLWEI